MRAYQELVARAEAAGRVAAAAVNPVPMVVQGGGKSYYVGDGVCGFGWVEIPGNTAFGKYMKAAGKARKTYPKGLSISSGGFSQSMARNEAYAYAYADVLQAAGIDAQAKSRMD